MPNSANKALNVAVVLGIAFLLVLVKLQNDALHALEAKLASPVVSQKTLGDNTVRSETATTTKEGVLSAAADAGIGPAAAADAKKQGADVTGVSTVTSKTPGAVATGVSSTGTKPRDTSSEPQAAPAGLKDEFGYFKAEQTLKLTEPTGRNNEEVVIGEVGFRAWEKAPWSKTILPRTYSVSTLLAQNEEGTTFAYSKLSVQTEGYERVELPITRAQLLTTERASEFRWNPELFMGLAIGPMLEADTHIEVFPSVALSLFSYGKTKVLPTFAFVAVGLGVSFPSNVPLLTLDPLLYNVGEPLPLVRNVYVGPTLGFDAAGQFVLGAGLRVAL